jgi:hypothetical protein
MSLALLVELFSEFILDNSIMYKCNYKYPGFQWMRGLRTTYNSVHFRSFGHSNLKLSVETALASEFP